MTSFFGRLSYGRGEINLFGGFIFVGPTNYEFLVYDSITNLLVDSFKIDDEKVRFSSSQTTTVVQHYYSKAIPKNI